MSDILHELSELSKEAIAVMQVLRLKAAGKGRAKVEVTAPELSRLANVGIATVPRVLVELEMLGYIDRNSYGISVGDIILAYKADSSDENRLATLEKEYTELATQLAEADETRLQNVVRGDHLVVITEIEEYMQRPLQTAEALYLGILFGRFGTKRVIDAYRQVRDTRFPIRSMWNMLNNGARGKAQPERELKEAGYQKVGSIKDL